MKRELIAVLGAFALLALPAHGGDPQGRQGDDRLTRIRAAYRVAEWPAPGPARSGVDPRTLEAGEWRRASYDVDPRRGEGVLRLARGAQVVVLTARVLERPADARAELLAKLSAAQRVLESVAGVGEVSFGLRDPKGRWGHVLGVRGNVLFDVRAAASEGLDPEALVTLALAFDRQVLAAQPLEPGQVAGPRLLGLVVTPARAGAPARVTLDLDPAAAPAAYVVFECTNGAGVLETGAGFELMAPTAGPVRITVFAASKDLRVARAAVTVEVAR